MTRRHRPSRGTLTPISVEGCTAADRPAATLTLAYLRGAGLTITDACGDGGLTVTSSDGVPSGTCPITIIRTYTVTDACGNSSTAQQTITIDDTTSPTISCVANQTRSTDTGVCTYTAVGAEFDPTATGDNCSIASVTNDFNGTATLAGAVFPIGATTVVWTITDDCGNSQNCSFVVTVIDNELPVIVCPSDLTDIPADPGECFATGVILGAPVTSDNCGVFSITNNAPVQFPSGTTIVIWTVTDIHGNIATCNQNVTVIDTEFPTFTAPPAITIYKDASCGYNADVTVTGDVTDEADNCDMSLDATFTDAVVDGSCEGEQIITRTWTLSDNYGNTTTHDQIITVEDTTAPTWTTAANALDVTLECSDAAGLAAAQSLIPVATDNCDPDVTNIVKVTGALCSRSTMSGGRELHQHMDGNRRMR